MKIHPLLFCIDVVSQIVCITNDFFLLLFHMNLCLMFTSSIMKFWGMKERNFEEFDNLEHHIFGRSFDLELQKAIGYWEANKVKAQTSLFFLNLLHGYPEVNPGPQSNPKFHSPNVHSYFLSFRCDPKSPSNPYKKVRFLSLAKCLVRCKSGFFWYSCSTLTHAPTFPNWKNVRH